MRNTDAWPPLPLDAWQDTLASLHMWTQIIGKIRLAQAPYANHFWHTTLYVTPQGLTTSAMPYGTRAFQIDLDLCGHRLVIRTDAAEQRSFPLQPRPVAELYALLFRMLAELEIKVSIWPVPVEVADPIPFQKDQRSAYDGEQARRFARALWQAHRVLSEFRGRFRGKASPVHFFWGGFDLAVTRFSGRPAPEHPAVPNVPLAIVREAYSHEVSSCGFWPGAPGLGDAMFYAYAYPEPDGFRTHKVLPREAAYNAQLGEFLLPYDVVRRAADPDAMLLQFLQTSYEAAAEPGSWDRNALEVDVPHVATPSRAGVAV
jgi:hypothetical protein